MAPRNTRNGAAATARRGTASGGTRAPSVRRTPGQPPAKRDRTCDSARPWWVLPLAVIVIVAAFGYAYYPVARVQYRETRERARLAAELDALKARNARLREEVALLRTPEGVEDYARTQLGLVKRGEHVVIVKGVSPAPAATTRETHEVDSDYTVAEAAGPWTAFLDAVFGVQ